MGARKLTPADIERATEMRERGLSLQKIGDAIGCSAKALSWHFLMLAVDPPKPPPLRPDYHLICPTLQRPGPDGVIHLVRAFTPAEDGKLVELERQGLTHTQIGRALGRKPNSVKGRLMTLARRDERLAG